MKRVQELMAAGQMKKATYLSVTLEAFKGELGELDIIYQDGYCPFDLFSDDTCDDENIPNIYSNCLFDRHKCNGRDYKLCEKCWNKEVGTACFLPDTGITAADFLEDSDDKKPIMGKQLSENDSAPAVFDYSELDVETAADLIKISVELRQLKGYYIIETAKRVAKAHDLLAKHGHGTFCKWCESEGITRQTANNFISIVKLFDKSNSEEAAILEQLNPTFLYEIAKPSAPAALVEQVKNGDITTHKDYIALKKELEDKSADYLNTVREKDKLIKERTEITLENDELREKNIKLEKNIKELENRPIEAQIIPDEEIERRAVEVADGIIRSKESEFDTRLQEMNNENRRLRNELSKAQDTGNGSEEQLTEFYVVLHDKAIYALRDCADFICKGNFPDELKKKLAFRFHNFSDLLGILYDDLSKYNNFTLED